MPKNTHCTKRAYQIYQQPKAEAGFVLLMVLVVIVLISGATVLLMNQNAVDLRSAAYYHQQQSLYAAADATLMPSWQLPVNDLSSMIVSDDGWLAALMVPAAKGQYRMVKSCDGWRSYSIGVSDGYQDTVSADCPVQDAGHVWLVAYALPVAMDHYLYRLMNANHVINPKDSATHLPAPTAQYVRVLMYAIAAQNRSEAQVCLSQSLLHAQISSCLTEQGVRHQLVAAEWLVSRYQSPDPHHADQSITTAKVIKLRQYDLRMVRE